MKTSLILVIPYLWIYSTDTLIQVPNYMCKKKLSSIVFICHKKKKSEIPSMPISKKITKLLICTFYWILDLMDLQNLLKNYTMLFMLIHYIYFPWRGTEVCKCIEEPDMHTRRVRLEWKWKYMHTRPNARGL